MEKGLIRWSSCPRACGVLGRVGGGVGAWRERMGQSQAWLERGLETERSAETRGTPCPSAPHRPSRDSAIWPWWGGWWEPRLGHWWVFCPPCSEFGPWQPREDAPACVSVGSRFPPVVAQELGVWGSFLCRGAFRGSAGGEDEEGAFAAAERAFSSVTARGEQAVPVLPDPA